MFLKRLSIESIVLSFLPQKKKTNKVKITLQKENYVLYVYLGSKMDFVTKLESEFVQPNISVFK